MGQLSKMWWQSRISQDEPTVQIFLDNSLHTLRLDNEKNNRQKKLKGGSVNTIGV